ncbi:MAG: flotillin domain-containing protein, partial [Candidatus Saccharicenans sp.]
EKNKLSQEIKKEEAKVKQIEKEEAIKIEELEIRRKERELEANVLKPADARKYQIKAEAEAEEIRLMAEGKGKAEAMRLEAQTKAEEIRLRGLAEAEAMMKKAQAWEKYNEAAILETFIKVMPELAKAVAEPLSKVEKIVIIGGDKGVGTSQITGQVTEIIAQMPEIIKTLTGADLNQFLKNKLSGTTPKAQPEDASAQGKTPDKK